MNEPGRSMKPHFSLRRIGPCVSSVNGRTVNAGSMIGNIIQSWTDGVNVWSGNWMTGSL